ncbi:ABC transporter permease [Flavobacterium haoranii]|uniref:Lipoprotein-releasing system permease protein n=1 Tax=Flavobacterium haoranii TaxID=683124 RepID=A0A1M6DZ81_9FLAO|nr:ABC transporter permease [Flavobacterium haoranii]SHI78574.1 lipoprotein-releasing system permease protein [Flavobacterium haoranii]
MNFSLYIAKRYAISFSKNSAINIITMIASLGVIAGTMALFVVLSVFSGLRDFSLSFTNAIDPDFVITPKTGKSIFISNEQLYQLNKINSLESYSKIIEERVLFFYNDKELVGYIKGVDEKYNNVTDIENHLYVGNWLHPNSNEVVVGSEISRKLGLGLFDYTNSLKVYSPKAGKGLIENEEDAFLTAPLNTVGIYNVSEDLDAKYIFCNLELAEQLVKFQPNQVTGIEFKLKPNSDEDAFRNQLQTIFQNDIEIKNRIQINDSLYKMLNTENIAVYLIFTLVIIIALFNLIGALIMMIIEKKSNLKTLNSLGLGIKEIRKIFLAQGLLLTIFGSVIGIILGIILVVLQQKLNLIMITPTLPYPIKFELKNLLIVALTISILGYLASLTASKSITKKLIE